MIFVFYFFFLQISCIRLVIVNVKKTYFLQLDGVLNMESKCIKKGHLDSTRFLLKSVL